MSRLLRLLAIFGLIFAVASPFVVAQPEDPAQDKTQNKDQGKAQGKGKGKAGGTTEGTGKNGAVGAGGQGAVDAGIEILKAGGNAADAAAASIFALSVTDARSFCFGGEVPILYYDAKRGTVEMLCGQGAAPKMATREYFAKIGGIPRSGIKSSAVPGAVDAVITLLERHGTKTFSEVIVPTLRLLDNPSAAWHPDLAKTLRSMAEAEKGSTDRRRGLRLVADYFYRGPVARAIDEYCQANGGLIRYSDMATHVTRIEDPYTADYRGYTVCKGNFWCQGPYMLQTLKMLEGYDLKAMGHNSADAIQTEVEAMKLALADRDLYFGDPNFAHVPMKELMSPEYITLRRGLIDRMHASRAQRPGDPEHMKAILENFDPRIGTGGPGLDTTTCVVADGQGNVVAATPSGFSGFLAGKTGVNLSSRLQQFNTWAGSANCIEPGKRPRITLTPTLVLKDGKPVLAISVAGGDMQDQAMLQHIVNTVDFGLNPIQAANAPRFGTDHFLNSFGQRPPRLGSLTLGQGIPDEVMAELKKRGHDVRMGRPGENSVMIGIDQKTGMLTAAGDRRAGRHAWAY